MDLMDLTNFCVFAEHFPHHFLKMVCPSVPHQVLGITCHKMDHKLNGLTKISYYFFFSPESQYGNSLLFMAVAFNTTLQFMNLGYTAGLPVYNNWENFLETQVSFRNNVCDWSIRNETVKRQFFPFIFSYL